MKSLLKRDVNIAYNPCLYFGIFTIPFGMLTYFSWSVSGELLIVLLGLVSPSVLFLISLRSQPPINHPPWTLESFSQIRPYLKWIFLSTLIPSAIALRLWRLGNPSWWPGGDVSLNAMEAVKLLQNWRWTPFMNVSQIPSTLSYFCCIILKATDSPLLGTQIPPAAVSILTLGLAYPTARQYFSKSLSLTFASLLAFSEWALLISRPMLPGITLPLWELLALYFLGRFLNARSTEGNNLWVLPLGFTLGLGPYTFVPWPVFFVSVLLVVAKASHGISTMNSKTWGIFFLAMLPGLSPFFSAAIHDGYGGFLRDSSSWVHFDGVRQARVVGNYFRVLFWGGVKEGMLMAPSGGFLNLFTGSFFFAGLLAIYRFRQEPVARFLGFVLFLSLLPGLLSFGIETHRIMLALPFTLAIAAIGLHSIILAFKKNRTKILLLTGLLVMAGVIDGKRYLRGLDLPDYELPASYRVLASMAALQGPGYVFANMIPNTLDFSLSYCAYPFNAALNPTLSEKPVKWAALFTEKSYVPFLAGRFPKSKWLELPTSDPKVGSRHALGLFNVDQSSLPTLLSWRDYCRLNERIDTTAMDVSSLQNLKGVLSQLLAAYPFIPNDPYLQSCFFEKLLFNYSSEKTFHADDTSTSWPNFSPSFQLSFEKSYQDTILCDKLGRLLASEGKTKESRKVLMRALKLSGGNPFIQSEIDQLDGEKNRKR